MSFIEIKNVCKRIKGKYILKDINLNIEKGKIYGFVGHNGCGKTMLFRAICNFINITEGEIIINGSKIGYSKDYPIGLGVIIEYPGFIESYTGYKNLEYLASINNIVGKEEIYNVLKEVGLFDNKDEKVRKYSLGMKQKLGIAQAIMENQELIVFDEPINALDDDSIIMFRNIIKRKKEEGKTILISSHNKEHLEDLFDYTVKMNNGSIKEVVEGE
ncbi:ABC transporter ATP-binding protein [Peptostreptococcus stomatis]